MKTKEYQALEKKLSSHITQKFSDIINHKQSIYWSYFIMTAILTVILILYVMFSFEQIIQNRMHMIMIISAFVGFVIIMGFSLSGLDTPSEKFVQKHLEETRDIAQATGSKDMLTLCNKALQSLTEAQKTRIASDADTIMWNMDRSISDFALH